MKTVTTGNVIKDPYGNIVIVTRVTDDRVDWVSFDYANSSGGGKWEDSERNATCYCNENYGNEYDPECKDCKGAGTFVTTVLGYKRSVVLASCVKEYILNALKKNFDF